MRMQTLFILSAAVVLAAVFPAVAKNDDAPHLGTNGCIGQDPLTPETAADVVYMREEEKLARDVYIALEEAWDMQIFTNIAQSEQRHMDAILTLIDCYGLVDPVVDDTPGAFTDASLAALYTTLVAAGSESPLEALKVGALIEELDIVDLRAALAGTDNVDVTRVFENLLCGSENHLRSFAAQLAAVDAAYTAQYLSQEEFDAIAASPRVPCGPGQAPGPKVPVDRGTHDRVQIQTRDRDCTNAPSNP